MNQRRNERNHLLVYLDVFHRDSHVFLGHLCDISSSGLMFISRSTYPLHTQLPVLIRLQDTDDDMDFSKSKLALDMEVRWIKPNLNQQSYCIGCAITWLAETDQSVLAELGRLFGVDDWAVIQRAR